MGDQIGIAKAQQPVRPIDCQLTVEDISPSVLDSPLACHVIRRFAQDQLGFDPDTLLPDLLAAHPMRVPGDAIVPGVPQWVHGSHPALNYRRGRCGHPSPDQQRQGR